MPENPRRDKAGYLLETPQVKAKGPAGGYASQDDVDKKKLEDTDWDEYAKSIGMNPMMFTGLGGGAAKAKHRPGFDTWRVKKMKGASLGELMGGG